MRWLTSTALSAHERTQLFNACTISNVATDSLFPLHKISTAFLVATLRKKPRNAGEILALKYSLNLSKFN